MARTTHLRKDFLLERYSIISEERSKRPHMYEKPPEKKGKTCFFCPGNEALTPPTIARYPAEGRGDWQIRVFRNKFPALKPPAGDHEIVVETNKHGSELQDLAPEEIVQVFLMYEIRRKVLQKKYGYVSVFKNSGREAGASIAHAHAQILAGPVVPRIVAEESEAAKRHYRKKKRCAWCDHMTKTGRSSRKRKLIAAKTDHTIALAAEAPRFPYEVWVMPRRHVPSFSKLKNEEALDFCTVLKRVLAKAGELGPYNFILHSTPKGASKYYHFHLEVMPRVSTHAGFELGGGMYIITASPETAASYYRR